MRASLDSLGRSTTFSGDQPNSVEFQLEFEEAKVIADNFFD